MKKNTFILLLIILFVSTVLGQTQLQHSNGTLVSAFEAFHAADFERAYEMLPFLRKRFINELKDESSFTNSYDSLSNYVGIKTSSDGLLKTYCWNERNGSCCLASATFAQFKTATGKVGYVDLEKPEDSGTEMIITKLYTLKFNNTTFYMLLGSGTCCGGKHYKRVKMYEIKGETLVEVDAAFGKETELFIEANRGQKIELKYAADSKVLSYNSYAFNEDTGFYTSEKSVVRWELGKDGFVKVD